ncbi:TetR/AcrR family transcriptional regulator [Streptomyces sp. NPDC048650]|uniref:TetR/AcrR family transcriptional regulator n=1 Tax=unclassified Streptomyces TaxID=2593676 RepID=UPI0037130430
MADRAVPDISRRSERSRRAIFDAALTLVGELGYTRLTIEGIASRAGVGKQTIYRWWPSKAAVLLDAFTAGADEGREEALPDTGDLAADLKCVLRATADEFNDPAFQAPYRALAAAGAADEELARAFTARLLEPGIRGYVDRIRAAQESGEVAADIDPRIAAELVLSPFSQRWLMRSGELTYDYVDTLVDLALRGLRVRG